jgi:hypothetical protein
VPSTEKAGRLRFASEAQQAHTHLKTHTTHARTHKPCSAATPLPTHLHVVVTLGLYGHGAGQAKVANGHPHRVQAGHQHVSRGQILHPKQPRPEQGSCHARQAGPAENMLPGQAQGRTRWMQRWA